MQVRFQREAEAELAAARVWYALQREGLDDELTQRVDETLQRIVKAPYAYPVVYRQLRRAVLRQFPLAIFYEPTDDEIHVFAVYHSSRDQKKLRLRVRRTRQDG
jgi:plasmid stabilization system protein ParE